MAIQGRREEALALSHSALRQARAALGDDHPFTAQMQNTLGSSLNDLARYGEAEALLRPALATRRRVLGEPHPSTAATLGNLAESVFRQGRTDEGAGLAQESLAGLSAIWCQDRTTCPGHPSLTYDAAKLAMMRLWGQARPAAATRLYTHAGDQVLARTRLRVSLDLEARSEYRRYALFHRHFVSAAWAGAEPAARPAIAEALQTDYSIAPPVAVRRLAEP